MDVKQESFISKRTCNSKLILFSIFNGINLKDLLFICVYLLVGFGLFFLILTLSFIWSIVFGCTNLVLLIFLLTFVKKEELKCYQILFLILKYLISAKKINPKLIKIKVAKKTEIENIYKIQNYFLTILKIDNVSLSELNNKESCFHLQKYEMFLKKLKLFNFDFVKLALPFHFFISLANKNLKQKVKNNFGFSNNFFLIIYSFKKSELINLRKKLLLLNEEDFKILAIETKIELYILNYFGFNFESKKIIFKHNYIKFSNNNYVCVKKISNYPFCIYSQLGQILTSETNVDVLIKKANINEHDAIKRVDISLQNIKANHFFKFSKQLSKINQENLLLNLQDDLINNNEFLSLFETYLIFKAPNKQELNKLAKKYCAKIKNFNFEINNLSFKQEIILQKPLISFQLLNKGQEISNLSFVLLWFFNNNNCIDFNGFLLGENLLNNSPVIFDQLKRNKNHLNSNLIILGTSGSGKTFNCFNHVKNNLKRNIKTIIIDFENEYLFLKKHCDDFLNLNFKDLNFNPFYIFKNSIKEQCKLIVTFFKIYFKNFNLKLQYQLSKLILELYLEFKISETNFKDFDSNWPTFKNLYQLILQKNKIVYQELKNYLWIFINEFEFKNNTSKTILKLNKKLTIINLANLAIVSKQNEVYLYLLLEFLNQVVNLNFNNQKSFINIIIDEAHLLLNETYKQCLLFFANLMKRIRKYNGYLTLITQNIADLISNNDAKLALLNNCQYLLIHKLNEQDLNALNNLFLLKHNLSEFTLKKLANLKSQECLLIDNLKIYFIRIKLFVK